MKAKVFFYPCNGNAKLPKQASPGSAGYDCYAALSEPVLVRPLERKLIPLGFKLAFEPNYEAQVRPRSGLALKHGITLLNSPGTIDSDFRGELQVILINLGQEDFIVEPSMRIAQLVFSQIIHPELVEVESLESSLRGEGGFGHSGV